MKPQFLRRHWKSGLVAAVLLVASGGLVLAQDKPAAPSTPPPAVETPPQEPAPKDVPPPPADKGPAIVAPATNVAPPIKAPDENQDDNSDDSDKKAKDDDTSKAADSSAAVAETPGVRAKHSAAIIQALDKVTAETMRFEVPIGKPIRYKDLVFTVRSCETSAPEELVQDSMAYVQVRAEPRVQSGEATSHQVFSGWMFASSPGLDAIEHPVYDAWLIACKA